MKAIFGFITMICFCMLFACSDRVAQQPKPNIILILADDMGFDDLGIRNKDLNTPNLDQLANESVSFSQFYVNPVCAPSRASLLTGRDFIRTGVSHVHGGKDFINLNETLLSQALKENGYVTGIWGKWHSGHSTGYFPWDRGFDEAYMADLYKHHQSKGWLNGQEVTHSQWADEVLVDYAIDFIKKNTESPFFAFISSLTPHNPIQAPEHIIQQYLDKGHSPNLSALYAMITFLDIQIGRLLQFLDSSGLAENTIIIFLSDNGPQISTGFLTPDERAQRYVSGLKGHKGNLWENGVKSPLFVYWKGKFKPDQVNELADITDLYPTLVALAGGIFPKGQLALDGESLIPILDGLSDSGRNKHSFNWAHFGWAPLDEKPYTLDGEPGEYASIDKTSLRWNQQIMSIRDDRYKLMLNPQKIDGMSSKPPPLALYDIINDPGETINLGDQMEPVVLRLKALMVDRFEQILLEPHAFEVPVFVIDSVVPSPRVWAKAPLSYSPGMLNSALELKHWTVDGSAAQYKIEVKKEGYYQTSIGLNRPPCDSVALVLDIEGKSYQHKVNGEKQSPGPLVYLDTGTKLLGVQISKLGNTDCDTLAYGLRYMTFNYQSAEESE